MIKPIETKYKGFLFRSRLEARWAVFFDALHIKWRYEPEGYELPPYTFDYDAFIAEYRDRVDDIAALTAVAGMIQRDAAQPLRYLPDFYLPEYSMWAEVKGEGTIRDYDKINRLVNTSRKPCLLCREVDIAIPIFIPGDATHNTVGIEAIQWHVPAIHVYNAIMQARSARFGR